MHGLERNLFHNQILKFCRRKVSVICVVFKFIPFNTRFSRVSFGKTTNMSDERRHSKSWCMTSEKPQIPLQDTWKLCNICLLWVLVNRFGYSYTHWHPTSISLTQQHPRMNQTKHFLNSLYAHFIFLLNSFWVLPPLNLTLNDEKMCQITWKKTNN